MNKLLISVFLMLTTIVTSNTFAAISPDQPTVIITGGNRGIGLEFVNQYSAKGWNVIATARKPAKAEDLQAMAKERSNIIIEQLDVTDHARIDALAEQYKDQPIDILINNAGITPKYLSAFRSLKGMDFDMARKSFEVNALGPIKIARSFMPHLEKSKQKKFIVISSKAGSFEQGPQRAMMYSYRASKAALNMLMYTLSFESSKKDIIVTMLSPGQVNTMGLVGKVMPGTITTEESVTKMTAIIDSLKPEDNGLFLSYEDRGVIGW